jgi:hypothetical protein
MIFQQMGVRKDNVAEALDVLSPPTQESPPAAPPQRVVLFTGHMIDPPGRATPRFPPEAEPAARSAIRSHLENERGRTSGQVIGMASGSSGGDILFHEVCQGLGIPTRLLLPIGHDRFRSESVSPAGRKWEERFDAILRSQARAPVLLSDKDELPIWLGVRQNYNTWQRANVWFLQEALAVGAPALTLLALWDGTGGDGPGGTEHMIRLARDNGAAVIVISTETLLDQAAEAPTVP